LVNVKYQIPIKNGKKISIIIVSLKNPNDISGVREIDIHLRSFINQDGAGKKRHYLFYIGLDGGTSGLEREKLINAFNAPNSNAKLFLLSTR
jgi:hypothetical protein